MFSMSYDRQFEKYDLKPRIFARIMTVTVNLQCYLTIMYLWSHRLCKYPPLQVEGHVLINLLTGQISYVNNTAKMRAISSVVERFLHTEEVAGSIPVSPTKEINGLRNIIIDPPLQIV